MQVTRNRAVRASSGALPTPGSSGAANALAGPLTPLAVVALLCALPWSWNYSRDLAAPDFYHFWFVSRAVGQSLTPNIYSPEGRRTLLAAMKGRSSPACHPRERTAAGLCVAFDEPKGGLYTRATPFLFAVMGVWGTMEYDTAHMLNLLLCLGAYVAGVLLLCRALGFPLPAALLAATVLMPWFEAFLSDTGVGNVNRLQLGALALFLWLIGPARWRHVLAGTLLGLLVVFKPNTLIAAVVLVGVWLIRKRYRQSAWLAAGGTAGAALALAVGALYFGTWRCWAQWAAMSSGVMADVASGAVPASAGNFGLPAVFQEMAGTGLPVVFGLLLTLACLAAAWMGRGRPPAGQRADDKKPDTSGPRREALLALGLGLAVMVLSAQVAWAHYYVLLIPLLLSDLRPLPAGLSQGTASLMLRLLVVLALAIMTSLRSFLPEVSAPAQGVAWVFAGLAVMAAGLRDLAAGE